MASRPSRAGIPPPEISISGGPLCRMQSHRTSPIIALAVVAWTAGAAVPVPQPPAEQDRAAGRRTHADLPEVRLSYLDAGAGIPIVLLHPASTSSVGWENQIPALTRAGYRVIAPDRRGYGDTVVTGGGASTASTADDLDALVAHLALDRFHLVGTGAGGIVATDFALSHSARLRSLVVANSLVGVQDEEYRALGRRLRPVPQFEALPEEFRELGPVYRAANPEGTQRWIELARASRPVRSAAATLRLSNDITFARLEELSVPTLLVTGDADLYTPPPVLELFARRIKAAEMVVIDGAGHSAYWEQPDAFNRAVLEFVRRH